MKVKIAGGLVALAALLAIWISAGGRSDPPVPSPTPMPYARATRTPAAGCPAFPEVPDAHCTGWRHTGVKLTTVQVGDSGPGWSAESVDGAPVLFVRQASAVIDRKDIPMCVKVLANKVTIKRSKIACASFYTVNTSDPPAFYSGLTLEDVEIDGLGSTDVAGIAVMGTADATYRRVDVHGFGSSGPRLASGNLLADSYIHGFVCAPPDHSAGTSANDGGSNITIRHNNIDISTGATGCASAAIELAEDFGTYNRVLIRHNLVNGGAYCMYIAQTLKSRNVRVEDNRFGRKHYRRCGGFGPVAQAKPGSNGNTFSGNTWDDTGRPVKP